jgi:hypothetical protein
MARHTSHYSYATGGAGAGVARKNAKSTEMHPNPSKSDGIPSKSIGKRWESIETHRILMETHRGSSKTDGNPSTPQRSYLGSEIHRNPSLRDSEIHRNRAFSGFLSEHRWEPMENRWKSIEIHSKSMGSHRMPSKTGRLPLSSTQWKSIEKSQ